MTLPWKSVLLQSLAKSLQKDGYHANFTQLATVNAVTGLAECRTIVFRGFLFDPPVVHYVPNDVPIVNDPYAIRVSDTSPIGVMRFTSDANADKIHALLKRPLGELCWYHISTREQFRLSCCFYPIFQPHDPRQPDISSLYQLLSTKNSDDMLARLHTERERIWHEAMSDDIRRSFYKAGQPVDFNIIPDTFVLLLAMPWRVSWLSLAQSPAPMQTWCAHPHYFRDTPHLQPEQIMPETGQPSNWRAKY